LKLFQNLLIGIGWNKRAFRKYFDSEDNYTEFHKKTHRLQEAPTIAITRRLQEMIEDWLRNVVKKREPPIGGGTTGVVSMVTTRTLRQVMSATTNQPALNRIGDT
jgi:hypothetical protein